ncbi:hypothetical protein JAAARDRAFT_169494 [Jaapia argillacea MUCL 33604]|uniref:Uncharacterized protein n=1 Tax=Jaapia argillacea MUCL 33604 TaxID=933084 RepID=A0A067QBL5_9AGAM|nr:hypothetical protein JAAARDRAFT_169494 [Jaapia argillacea MUCL 33604]
MDRLSDDYSLRRGDASKEFFVSVELYVSNKVASGLRKPQAPRKKSDKRESLRPAFGAAEDQQKKVKEKSSWLSITRGSTTSGSWRPGACRLSEEAEGCLLNVYIDETILYQSIYVHLLNHTDIRPVDRSLFFRKDCLGIHCSAGQRWTVTAHTEPLYLHFFNADTANTWLALLRSFAIPEVYGRYLGSSDGGLYRMWRQVDLTIVQARNLGTSKSFMEGSIPPPAVPDSPPENDALDLDVSCEIFINDLIVGRTTTKKGLGSPDWHESFGFPDHPPFDSLEIVVLREKKLLKPTTLGSVQIPLVNFRRGELVEGWFPILLGDSGSSSVQVGEIRLKMRVDEEIILPMSAYSGLLETINSRNSLDWMADLESKLQLNTLSTQLISIAIARNVLIDHIFELADREVDGTPSSHNTLFRGNTVLTKTMELAMACYGKAFLEASVGSVIRRLFAEKVAIEVDPVRCAGKSPKEIERNVDQLVSWCQEFWNQIYETRGECPSEMRKLFAHIRRLVEKRYQVKGSTEDKSRELPWQSVSAFCFLRFFVPAILHPHLFGLCPGLPEAPVQRSLTLIAKVMQSLANLNATVQREEFMRGVKDFLSNSLPAMIDYILVVSTTVDDQPFGHPYTVSETHDRLNVVNSLRQRSPKMPDLYRESIPLLPHLLDVPKHLAFVTSAVIRHARGYSRTRMIDQADVYLDEFCARCLEVEERALQRVSHLAGQSRLSEDRRSSAPELATAAAPSPPQRSDSCVRKGSVSSSSPKAKRRSWQASRRPAASARDNAGSSAAINPSLPSDVAPPNAVALDVSSPPTEASPIISPSSPSSAAQTSAVSTSLSSTPDMMDESRKRKGILRGILTRSV